jgi:hypothetical protein
MTIKQQGGVFGRNPTFNDVTIDGAINAPTTGSTGLVISGGTQSGTANALSGELRIGENPVYQGRIYYDYNAGDFYIENSYNNNNGEIIFRTKTNATPVEVGRFNQNGLAFPNGKGIDFSATAGTGTSELFDDYEEGTWTPVFQGSTSGSKDLGPIGKYTKIGRIVHVAFYATNADFSSAAIVGTVELSGLPFNVAVTGQGLGNIAINNLITGGSDYVPYAYLTNRLRFSAGSTILLSDAGLTQSASRVVAIALTYEAV